VKELKWIVTNDNREPMDIALIARIVVPPLLQGRDQLAGACVADVVATAYYESSDAWPALGAGLVSLSDSLYYCEIHYGEEEWVLVERVHEQIEKLHRSATMRHRTYEQAVEGWQAYRLFASELAAQLPMPWQAVGCDNPTQNHTGRTNGANHIVLGEAMASGRLCREPGDALCKKRSKFNGNLFAEADAPTCKQCLFIAEKIVHTRIEHLLEGSFSQSRSQRQ
jgi:hypothetical protein